MGGVTYETRIYFMFDVQIIDLPEDFRKDFGFDNSPYTLSVQMPDDEYDPYSLITGISIGG